MTQQVVDIGTVANDGTGDSLRVAFAKLNANETELYAAVATNTPEGLLAALLTVDGSGSGLNADLLDGQHAADFAAAVHVHAIADVTGLQAALDAKLAASAYTAADVLAKLLTVDGAGSGLDADTLDGVSSAGFATASHAHVQADITGLVAALATKLDASAYTAADVLAKLLTVDGTTSGIDADLLDGQHASAFAASSHAHVVADVTGLQSLLDDLSAADASLADAIATKLDADDYTAADVLAKLLTVDGSGSGLDADTLDGMSSAAFAAASHAHAQSEVTGLIAALAAKLDSSSYTAADVLAKLLTVDGAASGLDADTLDGLSSAAFAAASHTHAQADITGLAASLAAKLDSTAYTAADVLAKLLTVDGAGSGLDADTLDGVSSAGFATASHAHVQADITGLVAALAAKLDSSSYTAADVLAKLLTVDGAASGLDADLLDGISSAGFLQASTYQALTPTWSGLHAFTADAIFTSANPRIRVLETGLSADTGAWDFNFDGGSFEIRTRTDADGAGVNVFKVLRPSGSTTPQRIFIGTEVTTDPPGFSTVAANNSNYGYVISNGNNSTNAARLAIVTTSTSAGGFNTVYYGTSYSSPTQVASGVQLGNFTFGGYNTDTTSIFRAGAVRAITTEAWTASVTGTAVEVRTVATGTIVQVTTLSCLGQQCKGLDGTVSLPTWSWQNDPDCGFYRIGANNIGLSCNATNVLDCSTSLVAITATTIRLNTTTATTVGAAGGATALPLTPLGYLAANVGGTAVKIPYYNN